MTAPDEIGARLSLRDRPQFSREAETAARDVENIGHAAGRADTKSRGPLRSIGAGVMSVGRTAITAGAYVASGLGVAGAAAVGLGVKTAAGMETAEIAFTTMLGSADKAKAFLGDLSDFAAKTPFDLPGLQKSASSLVSAGIDASKVIPIMTSLGNATSGMGTGAEGIQRATVALQQMNAAQRITGEDLNQLRDAGIPVFDLLAAATGKSVKEVAALAQQGKLGKQELDQLMGALESGKGLERFNGLMEAQSSTMAGLWSTLKDTFAVGMADAIQPLVPLIKQGLGFALKFVADMMPRIKDGVAGLVAGLQGSGPIDGFSGRLNTLGLGMRALVLAFRDGDVTSDGFVGKMEVLGVAASTAWTFLKNLWGTLTGGGSEREATKEQLGQIADKMGVMAAKVREGGDAFPSLTSAVEAGRDVLGFLVSHLDTIIRFLPLIVAGFLLYKSAMAAKVAVEIASLPITAANIVANLSLASAQRALAFQLGVITGAQQASRLATLRATAATVANGVATLAMRAYMFVATAVIYAMAGAQAALNIVMSLNPFALVVLAIVALIAIFVVAYKKSETFRNIVNGAFNAIKVAAGVAVDWIVEKWRAFTGFFSGLKMPSVSWSGIKDGFRGAINWIIDKWNGLSFGIPAIDTHIPGVGKVGGFTLSTPDIPRLHTGGTTTSGGAAIIQPDEEMVVLPPAASVVPLGDGPGMTVPGAGGLGGGAGNGGTQVIQVVMPDGRVLAEVVNEHKADTVARS